MIWALAAVGTLALFVGVAVGLGMGGILAAGKVEDERRARLAAERKLAVYESGSRSALRRLDAESAPGDIARAGGAR